MASKAEFAAMGLMLSKPIIYAMIHIVVDDCACIPLDDDAEPKIVISTFSVLLSFFSIRAAAATQVSMLRFHRTNQAAEYVGRKS